jgi:hypothetical protein
VKFDIHPNLQLVYHTGGIPGVSSIIALFPDDNVGVISLCNTDHQETILYEIVSKIADSALGLEPLPAATK